MTKKNQSKKQKQNYQGYNQNQQANTSGEDQLFPDKSRK